LAALNGGCRLPIFRPEKSPLLRGGSWQTREVPTGAHLPDHKTGEILMPDYRLYFLDSHGKISHVFEFRCDADDSAIQLAETHADGRDMELWSLERRVRAFAPQPQS